MSIEDFGEKIKRLGGNGGEDRIFMIATLFLTALLAFGLGRLSVGSGHAPITVGHFDSLPSFATSTAVLPGTVASAAAINADSSAQNGPFAVFASKNGTKYYTRGCKAGNRISVANKIWFPSASDAQKLGLSLAAQCR